MSDNGMPTVEELELRELQRIRDENYSDLLDQMDEAWGHSGTIGRSEVNAFLESRIVHKPTTRLRAKLKALESAKDDFISHRGVVERCRKLADSAYSSRNSYYNKGFADAATALADELEAAKNERETQTKEG